MSKVLKGVVSFAVLLAIWQALAASGAFPSSLFPGPGSVAGALAERAESGQLLLDVGASMYRFFIGVRGGMRDGGSAGVGNGLVHASLGIPEPSSAIPSADFAGGMASVHRVVAWHWRYPRHRRYLLGGVLPGVALYGGRSAPH